MTQREKRAVAWFTKSLIEDGIKTGDRVIEHYYSEDERMLFTKTSDYRHKTFPLEVIIGNYDIVYPKLIKIKRWYEI